MTDYNREYQIHEHDGLRSEINIKINELNQAYRFNLTAISGALAWLVTLDQGKLTDQPVRLIAYWAPFFLTLFLLGHASRVRDTIVHVANYLKKVESELAMDGLGWENSEECKKLNRGGHVKFVHDLTGWTLLAVTLFFAVDMTWFVITHQDMFSSLLESFQQRLSK